MYRPLAVAAQVSMIDDRIDSPPGRAGESACVALCIIATACVSSLMAGTGFGATSVTVAGALTCIATALGGHLLLSRVIAEQQAKLSRFYDAVLRASDGPETFSVQASAQGGGPFTSLLHFVAELVGKLRKAGRQIDWLTARQTNMAFVLRSSHRESEMLVQQIQQDSTLLDNCLNKTREADHVLLGGIVQLGRSCEATDQAIARAADHVAGLTESVVLTTAKLDEVTRRAVSLSEAAQGVQVSVAAATERPAALLALIEALDHSSDEVGTGSETLSTMRRILTELVEEAADAKARVKRMDETVAQLAASEQALGQQIEENGRQIAAAVEAICEARPAMAQLRRSEEAVRSARAPYENSADLLGEAAGRMPSRAERLAAIFRGLPDLAPKLEF